MFKGMFICAPLWSKKGVTVSLAAKFAELSHAYVCLYLFSTSDTLVQSGLRLHNEIYEILSLSGIIQDQRK